MVVGACASHRAARRRVGRGGDGVAVQREVGHIRCALQHREAVGRVGGDHRSVLGPIHEGVACVGRRGQGGRGAVVVGACASHRAARRRVGRGGDGVAVQREVGHIRCALQHREAVGRVGGDHRSVLGPIHEGVACVGRRGQGGCGAVVIGACTRHCAARRRVGRGGDFNWAHADEVAEAAPRCIGVCAFIAARHVDGNFGVHTMESIVPYCRRRDGTDDNSCQVCTTIECAVPNSDH